MPYSIGAHSLQDPHMTLWSIWIMQTYKHGPNPRKSVSVLQDWSRPWKNSPLRSNIYQGNRMDRQMPYHEGPIMTKETKTTRMSLYYPNTYLFEPSKPFLHKTSGSLNHG